MLLIARVALALGGEGFARTVAGSLVTLIGVGLLVTVIVIQVVATIVTGGQTAGGAPTLVTQTSATLVPAPGTAMAPAVDGTLAARVIESAQRWLGVPYVFGGCSRSGVDCSCLVQNVFAVLGVHLPRVAVDQFNATIAVSDPQPGDLVFFANTYEPGISHVGIYIGNGMQINAPTTGQVVSVAPVFTGYWGAHYAGARRVRL
jgi:cell wall-associated NlpC family hydrolase